MHPETRITRGTETASRITAASRPATTSPASTCDYCSAPVRGCRSIVRGSHRGQPYSALVCGVCVSAYVQPGPRRRSAADCQRFWQHVGEYRTAVPRRDVAPAADWRADVDRARRELDALNRRAPRAAVRR